MARLALVDPAAVVNDPVAGAAGVQARGARRPRAERRQRCVDHDTRAAEPEARASARHRVVDAVALEPGFVHTKFSLRVV